MPSALPTSITYGGDSFDLTLPKSSLNGTDLSTIKVVLIRTGFSTHGMVRAPSPPARGAY